MGVFLAGLVKKTKKEFQESGSLTSNRALLSFLPVQPNVFFSCRFLSLLLFPVPFRSLLYLLSTFNLKTSYRKLTVGIFFGGEGGHALAQLVEALRYQSEGRRFESQWCHWNFSLT